MSEDTLTSQIEVILKREMKEMGAFILQKQCNNLGINSDSIEPKDLPKLSKALAEVFQSMGGPDKAKKINEEIMKLKSFKAMVKKEKAPENKIEMLLNMGDAEVAACQWETATGMYMCPEATGGDEEGLRELREVL